MSPRPLTELVSPDWAEALQPVAGNDHSDGGVPTRRAGGWPQLPASR